MDTPDLPVPAWLARLGPGLPQWPWSFALAAALNAALALRKLPAEFVAADGGLRGRSFALRVVDLGATATVCLRADGRFEAARGVADVCLAAALADFARIARREEDPDTLFFQRRLRIEGDTELGLRLKNLLDRMPVPDWLLA